MDLQVWIQEMKDQGVSPKRALFNIKVRKGSVSSEAFSLVKQIYQLNETELKLLLGWFPQLKDKPIAKHQLLICKSCQKGDETFINKISNMLDTPINSISSDGLISIEMTGCMGLCALGPNAVLDQQIYNSINTNTVFRNKLKQILEEREK